MFTKRPYVRKQTCSRKLHVCFVWLFSWHKALKGQLLIFARTMKSLCGFLKFHWISMNLFKFFQTSLNPVKSKKKVVLRFLFYIFIDLNATQVIEKILQISKSTIETFLVEAYLRPNQVSTMELFVKMFKALIIFAKKLNLRYSIETRIRLYLKNLQCLWHFNIFN